MVVVGVFIAIAEPAFSEWRDRSAINTATMSMLAKYKQARALAVAESRDVKLVFDTTNSTVVIDDNSGNTCSACKHQVIDLKQFSPDIVLKSNEASTSFGNDGVATNFGTIKLSIGSYFKCIVVNRIGRAYVQQTSTAGTVCLSL